MGRWLHDLADVCRRTGFPVVEVDGWQSRSRGGAGGTKTNGYEPDAPSHVMVHHTASGSSSDGWPDVDYIATGSQDAPISNLYIDRAGIIYVIAAAATNCNGSGVDSCGLVADDNMNAKSIAIEAGNNGVGEVWPDLQQDSFVKLCMELGFAYGIAPAQVHSHFEWAPGRKIDPAGQSHYASGSASWDMEAFRADVANAPPVPVPPPSGGYVEPPYPGEGNYGCSSQTCRAWQDAMILNGFISDNPSNHDGVWGNGMHNACLKMQQSWKWSDADGVGGPHTWSHLRSRGLAPCPKCGK